MTDFVIKKPVMTQKTMLCSHTETKILIMAKPFREKAHEFFSGAEGRVKLSTAQLTEPGNCSEWWKDSKLASSDDCTIVDV